mgnify:CR=1 FL=1
MVVKVTDVLRIRIRRSGVEVVERVREVVARDDAVHRARAYLLRATFQPGSGESVITTLPSN